MLPPPTRRVFNLQPRSLSHSHHVGDTSGWTLSVWRIFFVLLKVGQGRRLDLVSLLWFNAKGRKRRCSAEVGVFPWCRCRVLLAGKWWSGRLQVVWWWLSFASLGFHLHNTGPWPRLMMMGLREVARMQSATAVWGREPIDKLVSRWPKMKLFFF